MYYLLCCCAIECYLCHSATHRPGTCTTAFSNTKVNPTHIYWTEHIFIGSIHTIKPIVIVWISRPLRPFSKVSSRESSKPQLALLDMNERHLYYELLISTACAKDWTASLDKLMSVWSGTGRYLTLLSFDGLYCTFPLCIPFDSLKLCLRLLHRAVFQITLQKVKYNLDTFIKQSTYINIFTGRCRAAAVTWQYGV